MMDEVISALRDRKRLLVTGHLQPDGDSVGSMLALAHILGSVDKQVLPYNPDPIPARYQFLPGAECVVRTLPAGVRFDATIVVDCGDEKLLGKTWPGRDVTGTVIVLDHHRSHQEFGDVVLRTDACAVGEIVFHIGEALGVPLSPETAQCLYASMCTDTGGFRYASTTPEALRIAAALVERGAQPWKTAWHLFEDWPLARMQLLTDVLASLETRAHGQVALMRVTRAMLARHHATADMIEGFINYARMLHGVEVSALVSEGDNGNVRVSMRSRGRVPVDAVASSFGGGGHYAAAGCSFESAGLDAVAERIVAALGDAVAAAPPLSGDDDFWSRR